MKVFIVVGHCYTDCGSDVGYRVFYTRDKALECFKKFVESERESDWFKGLNDPVIIENYIGYAYWEVHDRNRSCNFCEYYMDVVEVE